MSLELYTVVYCSEDGDHSLNVLTKEQLEENLNEEYWGPDCEVFAVTTNQHVDLNSRHGLFIIKGTPVQPKAETKVTKWAVE